MDHPQTPRIQAPYLQQFQHRIVRVLGKVVQLRGEQATIDAGGNVDIILTRVSRLVSSPLFLYSWFRLCVFHFHPPPLHQLQIHISGGKNERLIEHIKQDSHLQVGHAVEIIGKVDGNLQIKVQAATDFGTNIGMYRFSPRVVLSSFTLILLCYEDSYFCFFFLSKLSIFIRFFLLVLVLFSPYPNLSSSSQPLASTYNRLTHTRLGRRNRRRRSDTSPQGNILRRAMMMRHPIGQDPWGILSSSDEQSRYR
jgi:replication factor A3